MVTFFAVLADLATVVAVIVGGIWTYKLFVKRRERYPALRVEHFVNHEVFPNSGALLRLELRLINVGKTWVRLESGSVRLQQVSPCPNHILGWLKEEVANVESGNKTEAPWPLIEERPFSRAGSELEPGEFESFYFDFFVPQDVASLIVYSYVANVSKQDEGQNIGWNNKTFYNTKEQSA